MIRFASPEYLYALILIPTLIGLYIIHRRRQRRLTRLFGQIELVTPLMKGVNRGRELAKFILLMVAIAILVLALARPQAGSKLREIQRNGSQIMLAVDVSRSMLAEDFKPNRLERTKYAISHLVEKLTSEQIGMVVFAEDAFIFLPITTDMVSANSFIRTLSTEMVPRQGTSIAKAIDKAIMALPKTDENHPATASRAIILITDGESHDDDPMAAAAAAAEQGIVIHTIGIGTPEGAPLNVNGQIIKDENDQIVVSRLDEEMLRNIASTTGGVYIRSTEQNIGLDEIFKQIDQMSKQQFKTAVFEEYAEQFFYLLYVVLTLLVVEFLIPPYKLPKKRVL